MGDVSLHRSGDKSAYAGIDEVRNVPPSSALRWIRIVAFGSLALAFPAYSIAAFRPGADRELLADAIAVQVTVAYFVGIFASLLPLPSLRRWTRFQRIQGVALPFVIVSYATHLTWELTWLILHGPIAESRDSMWAYPWWAYIDGGDDRYLHAAPSFLMLEVLSVINGTVGITGLVLLWRSRFASRLGILMVMATAVTHTVTTWYYYGSEVLGGFPSVNTDSAMDLGVKFILLNGPWLIAPWFVLVWGYQLLARQPSS